MPPPVTRYGPSGITGPFPHLQQAHLQQQQSQQHHGGHSQTPSTGLPPPSLGGHPGFGPGNPASNANINPFALAGLNGMGATGFPTTGPGGGGIPDGGGTGLGSHAAQMGFVRGAQMQQQQQQQLQQAHLGHDGRLALDAKSLPVKSRIRDVWKHNLAQEMHVLRGLVEKYPYISMVCQVKTKLRQPPFILYFYFYFLIFNF